jgi:hypothetical protein
MSLETTKPARRGLSIRTTLVLAGVFGLMVVGSAVLKTRYLTHMAERMAWEPEGFRVDRPEFDRPAFEQDPRFGLDHVPDESAQRLFLEGTAAMLRGDDRRALSRFTRAHGREPAWPVLSFYLGTTRLQLGNAVAASDDLEAAVAAGFDPPNGPAVWWLALARLYCGRTQEGRTLLRPVRDSNARQAEMARKILERLDGTAPPQTAAAATERTR